MKKKLKKKQVKAISTIEQQNKAELAKLKENQSEDEQSILQAAIQQAKEMQATNAADIKSAGDSTLQRLEAAGMKVRTMEDEYSELPALPLDFAGCPTTVWFHLVRYLDEKFIKLSAKQIRHYKFTPADFDKGTDINPEYNLTELKSVKWSQVVKMIKKTWEFRGGAKIKTPFLDMGKWIKFEW